MKKMVKKLSIILMMLVFVMGFAACSSEEDVQESNVDEMVALELESYNNNIINNLANAEANNMVDVYLESGDDFSVLAMTTWMDNEEELGEFKSVLLTTVDMEEEIYTVTSEVKFEERNATITINYDAEAFMPTYLTVEALYSFGETMQQAGLNTVMGIGIVFFMLLFLSAIIYLFKFIGKAVEGSAKKEAPKPAAKPAPAPAATATENLVDDGALVAVIAAAIAASENTSTDSFVVRSIRRKPNNKWSRA